MSRDCVIVADGCRARFFTLEQPEFPEVQSGPNLVEINDLVHTEKEMSGKELWSETKTGRNRSRNGGASHGYDDHREQHSEEYEKRFARDVAEETAKLTQSRHSKNVVLVAQKRMLGLLRNTLSPLLKSGIEIRELAKDLSKLPPIDLQEHLAREQLIPRRKHPAI